MLTDKKFKPFVVAGYAAILLFFACYVSYSHGMHVGIEKQKRPIYVKHSDFTTENIKKSFTECGIDVTPAQIERFGKTVKHVR